ncbi:hypothetical protein [Pseudomonas fragi]|uniref:hypothetical protein n=1 Tax=Pseudomonas fragi TaxID=296 RepID=UPI003918644B
MVQIPLTPEDVKYLERRLAVKDYPGGYQYLYDVAHKAIASQADGEVREQMLMTANWLISAKSINNLDNTYVSEMVYNSMQYAVERTGRKFTTRMYKNASDKLAHRVIADCINAKGILPIKEVIKRDVKAAVEGLGLEPWQWGGTLGDVFPVWMGGLGHDYVEISGRTFLEQMENYATVFIQNAAAIGMIIERYLDNVSMVVSIAAKVILERLLVAEVDINIWLPLIPGGGISTGTGTGGGSGGPGGVTSASNGYSTGGGVPVTSGEKPVANVDISLESVGGLNYIAPEQIARIKCLLDRKIDPLILDLDGSNVKLTNPHVSPVHFDMNNDGEKVQTGWSSTDEGIVVLDLDGNGKIDNVSELMSEYFGAEQGSRDSPSKKTFDNAFDALRSLDSNKDLKFDNQDERWGDARVWVDANHDGQSRVESTGTSELHSLDELSISQIDLNYTRPLADARNGNDIVGVSGFTQKGEIKEAVAVNFSTITPDDPSSETLKS